MLLQIGYYVLSVLGIIKKRSSILTGLMLFVMWIVFGLNTYNGDFGNYKWIYQNIQDPSYWTEFEPLFNVLMYVCSVMDLDFIQFRMIFAGIYILLLYKVIGKYTKNKAEVLGLYMLFPFLSFTSVIRSGMAGILIILAYNEIIAGNDNKIKFWIYMVLACLIHQTSIIFACYYFFRKDSFKKIGLFLVISIIVVSLIAYYFGFMYYIISFITTNERTLKWFMIATINGQEPRWILYLIIIDLMCLFISYLSLRESRITPTNRMNIRNPYAEDIFYISVTMLVFIPSFFVSNASARLIWQMLLLIIICYAKDDECKFSCNSVMKISFSWKMIAMVLFLIFCSYYANLPYADTENDGRLVFENNVIYEGW